MMKFHNGSTPKDELNHYDVYDNKTDFPIIIGGTAAECAKALGIKTTSFWKAVYRQNMGQLKRWYISHVEEGEAY